MRRLPSNGDMGQWFGATRCPPDRCPSRKVHPGAGVEVSCGPELPKPRMKVAGGVRWRSTGLRPTSCWRPEAHLSAINDEQRFG